MLLKSIPAWAVVTAALIVTACGGGGGGGIGGTGSPVVATSYGGVTQKGSVWVNGVEFQTTTATVKIDDTSVVGNDSAVKVGMVVQVDGSITDKSATTVTVEGSLKGFVEAVGTDQFTVMGQTVRVDDKTVYDNGVVPLQGERVEVHGLVVSDGVIQGGYISKKTTAPTPPFAVKGYVKNVNAGNSTFNIGNLLVNYLGADVSDLGSAPTDGQLVEVKGTGCGNPICGTLTASKVSTSGVKAGNGLQAEVEGFIATGTVAGSTSFTVGNQPVTTGGSTAFIGGTVADVLAGSRVEVEGSISAGVLAATKVRFLDSIRIEASIAARNGNTLTFTFLPGVSATANAFTELQGGLASVTSLNPVDFVRLRARPAAGGGLVITRIELRNGGGGGGGGGNRTILQAPVEVNNGTSLTLLGIVVTPAAGATFSSSVPGVTVADRAAFFAAAQPPKIVKARLASNNTSWDELELQED